eukprot:4507936-Amphidinium_carterae.1
MLELQGFLVLATQTTRESQNHLQKEAQKIPQMTQAVRRSCPPAIQGHRHNHPAQQHHQLNSGSGQSEPSQSPPSSVGTLSPDAVAYRLLWPIRPTTALSTIPATTLAVPGSGGEGGGRMGSWPSLSE